MHIWTNTFTKHSKCYKMGCIGPIGFFFPIWISVQIKVAHRLCFAQLTAVRRGLQGQAPMAATRAPTEAPEDPISFSWCSHQMREKKHSFLLQVSSLQYQTQVKRVAMGGRPTKTLVVCENMSQYLYMPGYTFVTCDLLFVYLHCCAPPPPQYLHQTVETVRETASGPVLCWALQSNKSLTQI